MAVDSSEHEIPHAPNLGIIIATAQANTIVGMGNMFSLAADIQRGIFAKKMDEIDPVQASAIRQIAMREAPIGPVKTS